MQQSFGVYLRQLRRQENLTQTELGGEEFSKSYVSAVELAKVVPSRDALRYFAERLNQPLKEMEQLLQQSEPQPLFALQDGSLAPFEEEYDQEVLALLHVMIQGNRVAPLVLPNHLTSLSMMSPTSLQSQERRAHYVFLQGLLEQEAGRLEEARPLLEYALALISMQYRAAILDALGTNYYRAKEYHMALSYHRRACETFEKEKKQFFDLALQIEFHCGNDCRMLQLHREACVYFERARRQLNANHNIKLAAELYLGLGYCTFAALVSPEMPRERKERSPEEVEQSYQLSIGYLVQSRTLYQVSSDFYGEMYARLLQAMVLLYFHGWKQRQVLTAQGQSQAKILLNNSRTFLDEAEEQARQILIRVQEKYEHSFEVPDKIKDVLYTAIAYLMRMHTNRARQGRENKYEDTAIREQMEALYISRQTMSLLEKNGIAWSLVQKVVKRSSKDMSRSESLPTIDDLMSLADKNVFSETVLAEIAFALGEIAEEMVVEKAGEQQQDARNYEPADRYFRYALNMAESEVPSEMRDPSYYVRLYQRYLVLVERRWRMMELLDEERANLIAMFQKAFVSGNRATYELLREKMLPQV